MSHSAIVTFRLEPSESGSTFWTDPFPKVFFPNTIPLLWSCIAPAKISEAEAEPSFVSTISGISSNAPFLPLFRSPVSPNFRPFVFTIIFSSKNSVAMPRVASNNPPPLFRTSMIIPFGVESRICGISALNSCTTSEPNCEIVIIATFSFISNFMSSRRIWSRTIAMSIGAGSPFRSTVSVTFSPFGPRIFVTASSAERLMLSSPSTLYIMSPVFSPASSAGEPFSGVMIVSLSSLMPISAPMPSNSPEIDSSNSAVSSGERNVVCGSFSEATSPFVAP